jgi:hypothetical protein
MKSPIGEPPPRGKRILSVLFPEEPRSFPLRRLARPVLRAVHILTSGTLLGGTIFAQPEAELEPWLMGTALSGFALMATDLHASLAVLCEVRGISVLVKLVLLALVPVFWDARVSLLIASLMIGAIGSHLPARYRHKVLLFPDRIVPDKRRG